MTYDLIQTEKSYKLQEKNYYMISFVDKNFQPNKIEVAQILKKDGLTPLKIQVVNPFVKTKKRGRKGNKVAQKRLKKYYVKLPIGQQITAQTNEQEQ